VREGIGIPQDFLRCWMLWACRVSYFVLNLLLAKWFCLYRLTSLVETIVGYGSHLSKRFELFAVFSASKWYCKVPAIHRFDLRKCQEA
jgi:hypothetical protein